MGKIKWGMFVVDGRGKVGGHVLSKNRAGAYVRTKVTPSNPQTSFQQAVRQRLGSLSSAWGGLTEPQRLSWNAVVDSWSTTDIFGDTVNPSGKNLFVKINTNRALVGEPNLLLAPLPAEMPIITVSIADQTALIFTVDVEGGTALQEVVIQATPNLSPGVFNATGKFRQIKQEVPANAGNLDITADYTAKFGAPAVGQKIFLRSYAIDIATGTPGVVLITSGITT